MVRSTRIQDYFGQGGLQISTFQHQRRMDGIPSAAKAIKGRDWHYPRIPEMTKCWEAMKAQCKNTGERTVRNMMSSHEHDRNGENHDFNLSSGGNELPN